jgi:hypothetical protein
MNSKNIFFIFYVLITPQSYVGMHIKMSQLLRFTKIETNLQEMGQFLGLVLFPIIGGCGVYIFRKSSVKR